MKNNKTKDETVKRKKKQHHLSQDPVRHQKNLEKRESKREAEEEEKEASESQTQTLRVMKVYSSESELLLFQKEFAVLQHLNKVSLI